MGAQEIWEGVGGKVEGGRWKAKRKKKRKGNGKRGNPRPV